MLNGYAGNSGFAGPAQSQAGTLAAQMTRLSRPPQLGQSGLQPPGVGTLPQRISPRDALSSGFAPPAMNVRQMGSFSPMVRPGIPAPYAQPMDFGSGDETRPMQRPPMPLLNTAGLGKQGMGLQALFSMLPQQTQNPNMSNQDALYQAFAQRRGF